MEKLEFLKRGNTYGSIEVIMESVEAAKLNSINQIKTKEISFIPIYVYVTENGEDSHSKNPAKSKQDRGSNIEKY